MNAVQFPTRIRYLCRLRAHLKCSYFSNINTRGADSVVASAYDWLAGGPALMPRRSTPVIFGIDTNIQRMTLLTCAASGALLCATHTRLHKTYTNVAQAAIPLYNGRPVCVYRRDTYACASLDLLGKKEKAKESGTPISFRSTTSPS